ncbi:alpha/beta hydrolase family protein [Aegicerativicinus sediminis]|uniref:alpha/beta hydrolase family protein n=1 Tax=Aegicerativicinus sediminis TaxID=2893202 RepID=UPI001E5CBBB3|nr:prolyl oligopeptidase family serine peptidase [Aegicerativicinus sediminis]
MKTLIFLFGLLFSSTIGLAQNGSLLKTNRVILPDSLQNRIKNDSLLKSYQERTELYNIRYLSDGLIIRGYLAKPKEKGTYPVIVYNRGGNRDFGELTDFRASVLLNKLASWGYVVLASNYRGSTNSEGREEFGGADVNDILNLIPLAEKLEEADTERMGIYGHSRGGMMTYLTLTKTCKFKAAVIGAGLANAYRNIEMRPEMEEYVFSQLVPKYKDKKDESLRARSAVYFSEKLCKTTPLMLLHGTADWRVSPLDALQMADSLYAKKHPFRLHLYEGTDHGLNEFRQEVNEDIKEFFEKYVKNNQPWPSLEPHGR